MVLSESCNQSQARLQGLLRLDLSILVVRRESTILKTLALDSLFINDHLLL